MNRYDCDVCLSAGSVNKWGYCEICGEDIEDPESRVIWRETSSVTVKDLASVGHILSSVGQDAA